MGGLAVGEDHFTRLLGCRDGLAHALISVRNVRQGLTGPGNAYLPPSHHRRRRQSVLDKVAELDRVSAIIERQLDDVKRAIAAHN